jgi:hypothetical protein
MDSMSEAGEEGVVQGADAQAEGILELGGGEARGALGARMDEVEDGLGLGQIHLVVQKGAFGEFAGLGLARAGGKEGVEDALGGLRAAVALDFDGILAGIGVRRAENQQRASSSTSPVAGWRIWPCAKVPAARAEGAGAAQRKKRSARG